MGKCRHFLYGVVAVLLVLTFTVTACAPGPTPTRDKPPAPAPAPAPAAMPISVPAPTNWTVTADGYREANFTLPPNGICRINIHCERGQLIEYSWKADNFIADWYITPGGIPKVAGWHDEPITPLVDENGVNEEGWTFASQKGDSRTIELKGDYNGPGYYTLCFYNSERNPSVNVIFRYRVRQESR